MQLSKADTTVIFISHWRTWGPMGQVICLSFHSEANVRALVQQSSQTSEFGTWCLLTIQAGDLNWESNLTNFPKCKPGVTVSPAMGRWAPFLGHSYWVRSPRDPSALHLLPQSQAGSGGDSPTPMPVTGLSEHGGGMVAATSQHQRILEP